MTETKDALYKGRAFEASLNLEIAIQCLKNADVWVAEAAAEVEGYPVEHRLISLLDGIKGMMNAVTAEKERLEKGENENEKPLLLQSFDNNENRAEVNPCGTVPAVEDLPGRKIKRPGCLHGYRFLSTPIKKPRDNHGTPGDEGLTSILR